MRIVVQDPRTDADWKYRDPPITEPEWRNDFPTMRRLKPLCAVLIPREQTISSGHHPRPAIQAARLSHPHSQQVTAKKPLQRQAEHASLLHRQLTEDTGRVQLASD